MKAILAGYDAVGSAPAPVSVDDGDYAPSLVPVETATRAVKHMAERRAFPAHTQITRQQFDDSPIELPAFRKTGQARARAMAHAARPEA